MDVTEGGDRPSFTDAQIAAFRLRRHHLDLRAPRSQLANVVGDVCGVQAQVTSMAHIALWARLRSLTSDEVDRALVQRRSIVKTWSMRGTLHLHASKELLVVLGGLMPTRLSREQRWIRRTGLDEEETTPIVVKALQNGPLTKGELADYLAKHFGATTKNWRDGGWGHEKVGSSLGWYLVRPAMVRGLVCFGPSDGQEVTFAKVEQWLRGRSPMMTEPQAEEALVRRYLRSFGPADAQDLQAWAGIYLSRIRAILDRLRDDLVEVDRDGRPGFLLRKDLPDLERSEGDRGVVRLLPSFDAFMMGHRNRNHLLDRAHYKEVYKDQGWLAPVVLVDGRVAATWSHERTPRRLDVAVKMFTHFGKETRTRLEEEASDLSRFLETRDLEVRFTK